MILESAAVGPFFKNGYVAGCENTRKAVFIDPGDEVEQLLDFIRAEKLDVTHILLTHAHVDHVSGVAEAKRALGVPIYLHKDDLFLYQNAVRTGMMFGLTVEEPPPVDRLLRGRRARSSFGDYQVRVVHTPGHCPGGVCLAISKQGDPSPPHLFVGDTLVCRFDRAHGSSRRRLRDVAEGDHRRAVHVSGRLDRLFRARAGNDDRPREGDQSVRPGVPANSKSV